MAKPPHKTMMHVCVSPITPPIRRGKGGSPTHHHQYHHLLAPQLRSSHTGPHASYLVRRCGLVAEPASNLAIFNLTAAITSKPIRPLSLSQGNVMPAAGRLGRG